MTRHVPGVKMSGCINQLYIDWIVIVIDTERTCGYTLHTTRKRETKALLKVSRELQCNNLLVITKWIKEDSDFSNLVYVHSTGTARRDTSTNHIRNPGSIRRGVQRHPYRGTPPPKRARPAIDGRFPAAATK